MSTTSEMLSKFHTHLQEIKSLFSKASVDEQIQRFCNMSLFVLGVSIGKADCVQINLNPEAGRGERSK